VNGHTFVSRGRLAGLLGRLKKKDERGVVLVFALVLMLVLAIIGASMTMTSQVDLTISGNTKVIRQAFYVADAGIDMSPEVLAEITANVAVPTNTPLITYDTANLVGKVMGYTDFTPTNDADTPDLSMTQGLGGSVGVEIQRKETTYLSGGGVEFSAGTAGAGTGAAASTAIYYSFDSTGQAGNAAAPTGSEIIARYRLVQRGR
jgi:Tfp pilus assembly protein PilX